MTFFNGCLGVEAVFEGVLVPLRRPRAWRAPMHSAPSPALDRRRSARVSAPSFGAAARARQHRASVPRVGTRHFFLVNSGGTAAGWGLSGVAGVGAYAGVDLGSAIR